MRISKELKKTTSNYKGIIWVCYNQKSLTKKIYKIVIY